MESNKSRSLSPSSYKLNLLCIFLIYSLDSFGIALAYPIFTPIFLADHTPFFTSDLPLFYKTLSLGVLLSLFPIAQFVSVPFIGEFSDRAGRKKTLSFTLIGSTCSYFLAGIAVSYHSLLLLFVSRIANGIFAGNTSLCFASLSDISKDSTERSKNFGLLGAFGGISFFLAILCGEYFFNDGLSFFLAPAFPFLVIAFLSAITWILMLLLFHEVKPCLEKKKFKFARGYHNILSSLNNATLKNAYLIYFFFAVGWISMMQFYPVNLMEIYKKTPFEFTINLVLVGVMWSLANFLAQGFLCKRFTPRQILWICLPLLFFLLLSCSASQSYVSFTLHFSFAVFLAGLIWTNTFANVSLSAPTEIQGRIMGINQSFSSIATIAATLGGSFFVAIYPSLIFILSTTCIAFAFFFLKKQKN